LLFLSTPSTTTIYTLSLHDALPIFMLICILTKNVITSCSVTMMLFLHLEVKPLMTLTTVLYLSCALISGHLAMMRSEERRVGKEGSSQRLGFRAREKNIQRIDEERV